MAVRKLGRPATYADIEALPENLVGEILGGELVVSPRPGPRHAAASSDLGGLLQGPFRFGNGGPGGWRIIDEPELHLGGDVLVPDMAGWRLDRMPTLPAVAYFGLGPDWVCEFLSPSTRRYDRGPKLAIYAREQVPYVWMIEPEEQILEVLRLDGATYRILQTFTGDAKARAQPFDAIELDLARLWAP